VDQKQDEQHEQVPIEPGHVMSKKKYRELLEGQQK
jgi:hypothetical protein